MYYECDECGQLATFEEMNRAEHAARCPVCEELTHWTLAFADEELSF
jgi:uncharacterized paraquat-inducible protein A